MSKCQNCRKIPSEATWWEQVCEWLMYHLFGREVNNLSQEKYTQGFADGRKEGYKWCMGQQQTREEVMASLILDGTEMFKPYVKAEDKQV